MWKHLSLIESLVQTRYAENSERSKSWVQSMWDVQQRRSRPRDLTVFAMSRCTSSWKALPRRHLGKSPVFRLWLGLHAKNGHTRKSRDLHTVHRRLLPKANVGVAKNQGALIQTLISRALITRAPTKSTPPPMYRNSHRVMKIPSPGVYNIGRETQLGGCL